MIYQKEMEINTMVIDSTFWVAISFAIFIGGLIYLKIPQKVNDLLDKLISDIKNEVDESEKLRTEAKTLLNSAQDKLNTAQSVSSEIINQAKRESDKQIILRLNCMIQIYSQPRRDMRALAAGRIEYMLTS